MQTTFLMVNIYFQESDLAKKERLARHLIRDIHDRQMVRGATLQRAISGFGHRGQIHEASILHPEAPLPLRLEFFDTQERAQAAIKYIKENYEVTVVHWPVEVDTNGDA